MTAKVTERVEYWSPHPSPAGGRRLESTPHLQEDSGLCCPNGDAGGSRREGEAARTHKRLERLIEVAACASSSAQGGARCWCGEHGSDQGGHEGDRFAITEDRHNA